MTLITPEYQMATRELNYVIPENKGEIGPILANGQGHLLKVGKQNETEFFVRWTKSLKTEPMAEDKNLLRILVDGQAFSKIKSDTNIRAEHLDLIVRETPKIKIDEKGEPKQSTEFLPVKLVGTGNVQIASEKLSGTAESLTAFWEEPNKLSGLPRQGHVVAYRGKVTQQSGYSQGQQFQNAQSGFREVLPQGGPQSSVVRASAQTPVAQTPVAPKRKMKFDGKQVTVKLSGHSKDAEILDLLIDGNVDLTNQSSSKSLKITGDSLRLIPQPGEGNFRVQVSSSENKPAQVLTKDFKLTGKVINLDQVANKMWVEGEGNMSISPTTRRLPGSKKATLKKMNARWIGGMVFDGNKIYFEKDVVLDVEQTLKDEAKSTTHASSQGLSITLKNPVNLKEISDEEPAMKSATDADPVFDVQELVLTNTVSNSQRVFASNESVARTSNVPSPNVVVEARTFDRNDTPIEQKIINVPYMKIDADSGAISAKGPGFITTYQLNDGSKKNSNPFGGLTGKQDKKAPVLSLVRVNFDGSLDASSIQKEMFVSGNLRTVYSPVANWKVMMNPDNHQPSPNSVHLTCEKLHLAQWVRRANAKDSTEMIATGNARIQSDVFQATADRVSYSENSDTLTVEGTPRNDANLWYKQAPNDRNPTHLIAEKITYRVKDQATETHGIKKLNINRK